MSLSFPSSPSIGNLYFSGGNTWKWTGTTWVIVGSSGFQGSIGFQGSSGAIVAPGSTSQVLYNDGVYANASAGLTFSKTSNNLFVGNTLIANSISANGYIGSAGQLLYSNSSGGIYWANAAGGFANGQSIAVNVLTVNSSLTANGITIHNANLVANSITIHNANVIFSTTLPLTSPAGIIANGSIGTAFQTLLSNGTGLYWDSNTYVSNSYFSTSGVGVSNSYASATYVTNNTINSANIILGVANVTFNSNVVHNANITINAVSAYTTFASKNYVFNANTMAILTNNFSTYATTLSSSQYVNIGTGTTSVYAGNGYGFTSEFFVKFNTLSTTSTLTPMWFDNTGGGGRPNQYALFANTTTLSASQIGYGTIFTLTGLTIATGVWYHMAWIGFNNNMYFAINGTVYDLNTVPSNGNFATGYPYNWGGIYNLSNATYSNIRVVANNNIYSIHGFIPPNAPLNAPPGTSLLNFQSSTFADSITGTLLSTTGTPTLSTTTINLYPTANNNLVSGTINNGNAIFQSVTTNYIQTPTLYVYGANGAASTLYVSNGVLLIGNTSVNSVHNSKSLSIYDSIAVSNLTINSTSIAISNSTITNAKISPVQTLTVALSDESTQITQGIKIVTRAPYAMTLVPPYARISLSITGTTTTSVDITSGGSSIFSATPSLASGVISNTGPASMSATGLATIADDTQLQFSVSANGAGASGLKATLYYVKI